MDIVYSILFCERRFDFNLMRRGVGGNIFRKTHQKVFFAPYSCWDNPAPLLPRACFFFFRMVEKNNNSVQYDSRRRECFMSSVSREFPSTNSFETQASHRFHQQWAWSSQVRATYRDRGRGELPSARQHNERSSLEFADSDHKT